MIYSDVFLMHCQTDGEEPCLKEENKYKLQKKKEL